MTFTNLEQFNSEINNFAKVLLPAQFLKYFRSIAIALLTAIVRKTPVGNIERWQKKPPPGSGYVGGRARGNWQVSINTFSETDVDVIDASGQATIDTGIGNMIGLKVGDEIHITNNLPYILRLENEAWSEVAPSGMVGISLEEMRLKFPG